MAIVGENHAESKDMLDVCRTLYYYPSDNGMQLLRTLIAKSPIREVQGRARYSLALSLENTADMRYHPYGACPHEAPGR